MELGKLELFSDVEKLTHTWKSGSLQFLEFITHLERAVKGSHNMSIVAFVSFFQYKAGTNRFRF